jgi:iron complex outermembrane receptor protein
MINDNFRKSLTPSFLYLLTVALSCAILPGTSVAQDNSTPIEEIVVTGSHIARDPTNYVGPMSIVTGDEIAKQPTYSLQDMLLKVPSIGMQGTTRNNANGGRGAQFTGIHQLTPQRTLVLMNGRRMVSTIRDSLGLAVDMQSFPVNMIEKVEVLADGASAVYGSDAIAGVINVKTKSGFNGVEISGGAGTPQDSGGKSYNAGILMGMSGSRGSVTAAMTITDNGDVDYQQRKWAKVPLLGQLDVGGGTILSLIGSGIPPQGRVPTPNDQNPSGTCCDDIIFIPNPGTGESFQHYDTFGFAGLNGSSGDGSIQSILQEGHRYNYNDIPTGSSLVAGSRLLNGAVTGEVYLKDNVTAYFELLGMHRSGTLNFTPLPIADAAGRFTDLIQVPYTNPHLPADAAAYIASTYNASTGYPGGPGPTFSMWWRGLELGARRFDYTNQTIKSTAGIRGDFDFSGRSYHYDTWMTYGRSDLNEVTHNQVNVAKLQTAVDPAACALDPACPGGANPTLNIFGLHPTTAAEQNYILFDDQEGTTYDIWHLGGTVTGDILDLPAGPLGMAAGGEWRRESGTDQTSGVVQAGDSGGNYAAPTKGHFTVWELFAEFHVPLVVDRPMVKDLSMDGAVRYSSYNNAGDETTYKVSLRWAPVDSLSVRGVFSTGFRAPDILESYGGVSDSYLSVTDPCNSSGTLYTTNATVQANCLADGVPPGFIQNAAQLKISQGGNPDLKPETSDNYTIGLVFNPPQVENLGLTADWYSVKVNHAINTPDPVDVITTCYTTPGLAAPECARIGRGPTGSVVRFDLLLENLASIKTSGIDMTASYSYPADFGLFTFNGQANWLNEYVEKTDTGVVSNRTGLVAGNVSDWAGYPKWRANTTIGFERNNWSVGAAWRYIDAMKVFDVIEFDNVHLKTPAVNYFDLFGSYKYKNIGLTLGIQNVGDKTPPYVTDVANNTSAIYDYLGRFYYMRMKFTF